MNWVVTGLDFDLLYFGATPLAEPEGTYLLIESFETKTNEIVIKMRNFPFQKDHLQISPAKCRHVFSGADMLSLQVLKPV